MAFVYRAPRYINFQSSPSYHLEPITTSQIQVQNTNQNSICKKQPIKGSTCNKNNNDFTEIWQNYIYIATNQKQLPQKLQKLTNNQKKIKKKIQCNDKYVLQQKNEKNKESPLKQSSQFSCKGQKFHQQKHQLLTLFTNQQQHTIDNLLQHKRKTNQPTKQQQSDSEKSTLAVKFPSQDHKSVQINTNLLNSKIALGEVYSVPSIPGKLQKYGYVINENHLSYPKLVTRPNNDTPGPTDYTYTLPTKVKSILNFNKNTETILKIKDPTQQPPLINDQQSLINHNNKIKQWLTQIKKNKTPLLTQKSNVKYNYNLNQFSQTSDQQSCSTGYQDNTTPGPGYYNHEQNQNKDFRSKNKAIRQIFYSKSNRFAIQKPKKYPPYKILSTNKENSTKNDPNKYNKPKNKFFVSKLKREIKFQNPSTTPPPGYYNIRASMQNDVIQHILKTSPNLFNNKLPRLINITSSTTPGPGTYSINQFNSKMQNSLQPLKQKPTCKKPSHLFSNIKKQQQLLLEPAKQKKTKRIHQKQYYILKQHQNTIPFLTKSSKGLPYTDSPNSKPYQTKLPKQKLPPKQNIHPFNSSSKKNQLPSPHYLAQIGLYQLCQSNSLQKKSYNILFN